MQKRKTMGPLTAIGTMLSAMASTIEVVDNTIKTSGDVIHSGLQGVSTVTTGGSTAIKIVVDDAVDELREDTAIDSLIRKANNKVRLASAQAEADRILATLDQPLES